VHVPMCRLAPKLFCSQHSASKGCLSVVRHVFCVSDALLMGCGVLGRSLFCSLAMKLKQEVYYPDVLGAVDCWCWLLWVRRSLAGSFACGPDCFAAAAAPGIIRQAEQLVLAASFAEASLNGGRTEQQLLWQLQHAPVLLLLLVLDRTCSALCHKRDDPMVTLTKAVVIAEGMCWAVKAAAWLLVPGIVGCSKGWLQVADTPAAASLVLTWSCDCIASAAAGEADSIWLQLQLVYSGAPFGLYLITGS